MAISQGDYTIGVSDADYTTIAAFKADMAATLTGAVAGTVISALTENTNIAFTTAMAGYSITITSDTPHNGKPNSGHLITITQNLALNANAISFTCTSASAGAAINLSNLNIIYTGTATTLGRIIEISTNTTNISHNINDILINANGKRVACVQAQTANAVMYVFNAKLFGGAAGASEYAAGINVGAGIHSSSIIENCAMYNFLETSTGRVSGVMNYANAVFTIKNCASFANSRDYSYGASFTLGTGNATANKCASSDTSGSEAGLRSLVTANQFSSLVVTNDYFLRLKAGSALLDSGIAPSIAANTYGIAGTPRPHDTDKYSIGADEYKNTFPSITITNQPESFSDSTPFNITITASENIFGFISSGIDISNAGVTDFSGSGTDYVAEITPDGSGFDIVIQVPADVAVDYYGNSNTASNEVTVVYAAAGCLIRYITPNTGTFEGGTSFTIKAESGLTDATGATIGGEAVTDFTVVDDHTITGTTPAHAIGQEDLVIAATAGDLTLEKAFSFIVPEFYTRFSLDKSVVPTAAGTLVTVTLDNDLASIFTGLTLLDVACTDRTVTSANTLTFLTPALTADTGDVVGSLTGYADYTLTNAMTAQAGASAPGAPVIVLTTNTTTAVTLSIIPPEDYQAIDIYRDDVLLEADIASPVSYTDSTVAETTTYEYVAKARNATGTSIASNAVSVTTPTGLDGTDSKLEEIENAIIALIDGIDKVDGYFYDWGATNEPDFAKKTAFPCADVFVSNEENNDDFNTGHSGAYANATVFEIHVFSKLETECDNPQFEINKSLNKALEDLKKLFGVYDNVNDTCNAIYYSGMTREFYSNGNIVTTGKMITRWTVHYTQSRINPQINAN